MNGSESLSSLTANHFVILLLYIFIFSSVPSVAIVPTNMAPSHFLNHLQPLCDRFSFSLNPCVTMCLLLSTEHPNHPSSVRRRSTARWLRNGG